MELVHIAERSDYPPSSPPTPPLSRVHSDRAASPAFDIALHKPRIAIALALSNIMKWSGWTSMSRRKAKGWAT